MPALLFLAVFVTAPLAELYVMINVGREIGALATVGLCLFTAALGGLLVRLQGITVLLRVREMLARGEVPAIEMLEGLLLLVAGILLLLPGFITDSLGFLLLVPRLRRALLLWFLRRRGVMHPGLHVNVGVGADPKRPRIIDADYRRED